MMSPQKRPIPLPSQGTLVGWAKKRQTIAETVVAETILKTDNVPERVLRPVTLGTMSTTLTKEVLLLTRHSLFLLSHFQQ